MQYSSESVLAHPLIAKQNTNAEQLSCFLKCLRCFALYIRTTNKNFCGGNDLLFRDLKLKESK